MSFTRLAETRTALNSSRLKNDQIVCTFSFCESRRIPGSGSGTPESPTPSRSPFVLQLRGTPSETGAAGKGTKLVSGTPALPDHRQGPGTDHLSAGAEQPLKRAGQCPVVAGFGTITDLA